jgi:hypothetical protein
VKVELSKKRFLMTPLSPHGRTSGMQSTYSVLSPKAWKQSSLREIAQRTEEMINHLGINGRSVKVDSRLLAAIYRSQWPVTFPASASNAAITGALLYATHGPKLENCLSRPFAPCVSPIPNSDEGSHYGWANHGDCHAGLRVCAHPASVHTD